MVFNHSKSFKSFYSKRVNRLLEEEIKGPTIIWFGGVQWAVSKPQNPVNSKIRLFKELKKGTIDREPIFGAIIYVTRYLKVSKKQIKPQ